MIVAFLDEQAVGATLEPPKNPHITVKKKFKLTKIDEAELIQLLKSDQMLHGEKKVITASSQEYGSAENMIIRVSNEDEWRSLHEHLIDALSDLSVSRDPHFEGENYLPHITWRLKGVNNLDPTKLENNAFTVRYIYLIERIHPTKSIARIVEKIPLKP